MRNESTVVMKRKIIIRHLVIISGLLVLLLFVWRCPLEYLFGIPCPCCGMTRAFKSMVSLDFRASFSYHPLLLPTGFAIWYILHKDVLPKRFRMGKKTARVLGGLLLILLLAVYVYRIAFQAGGIIKIDLDDGLIFKIMREIRG